MRRIHVTVACLAVGATFACATNEWKANGTLSSFISQGTQSMPNVGWTPFYPPNSAINEPYMGYNPLYSYTRVPLSPVNGASVIETANGGVEWIFGFQQTNYTFENTTTFSGIGANNRTEGLRWGNFTIKWVQNKDGSPFLWSNYHKPTSDLHIRIYHYVSFDTVLVLSNFVKNPANPSAAYTTMNTYAYSWFNYHGNWNEVGSSTTGNAAHARNFLGRPGPGLDETHFTKNQTLSRHQGWTIWKWDPGGTNKDYEEVSIPASAFTQVGVTSDGKKIFQFELKNLNDPWHLGFQSIFTRRMNNIYFSNAKGKVVINDKVQSKVKIAFP